MCDDLKNGNTTNQRGKKRFYWDCVLNNYELEDCECVKQVFENIAESYIVSREVGKECGTRHLQMMIKLYKGNYKSFILNKFKGTCVGKRISIREGRNIDALKEYVMKDNDILYRKNVNLINSEKVNKRDKVAKEVEHLMLHHERLSEGQLKWAKNNKEKLLPLYKDMLECAWCGYRDD